MSTSKQFMPGNAKTLHGGRVQPSIAMSGVQLVSVYRDSVAVSSALYYKRGTANSDATVSWSNEVSLESDSGTTPVVAMNSQGVVIEIHEADSSSNELWAHIGQLDDSDSGKINWSPSRDTKHNGSMPAVALAYIGSQHIAVAAYNGGNNSQNIYFLIGKVDVSNPNNKTVAWTKLNQGITGYRPKITLNNNGDIVVVFDNGSGSLRAMPGSLNDALTDIGWQQLNMVILDDHCTGYGDVCLTDHDYLAFAYQGEEIHYSSVTVGETLSYPTLTLSGTFDSSAKAISLNYGAYGPGLGKKPSIATNGNVVIMVQETPDIEGAVFTDNDSKVLYSSSRVMEIPSDRAKWMGNYSNKTLRQLALPGAHDAGMSVVGYCTNLAAIYPTEDTKTQWFNFNEMLGYGIRYFDVRPAWFQNAGGTTDTYTGHFSPSMGGVGCLGLKMKKISTDTDSDTDNVFDQVLGFLNDNSTSQEVVILKFSHYFLQIQKSNHQIDNANIFDYNDPESVELFKPLVKQLIQDVVDCFSPGEWLYQKPTNETRRLVDIPLSTITHGKPKVIAVFDFVERANMNLADMFSNTGVTDPNVIQNNNKVLSSVYSYADYFVSDNIQGPVMSGCDLTVYDHYTNTDDIEVMVKEGDPDDSKHPGQRYLYQRYRTDKLAAQNTVYANMLPDFFLLSWTLTQQLSDIVAGTPSIEILARQANCCLGSYVQKFIQEGDITATCLPNVIYTDLCNHVQTDICNYINAFLHSS